MKSQWKQRIKNGQHCQPFQKVKNSCELKSNRDNSFKNMEKFVCVRQTAYLDGICHCQFCRLKKTIPLVQKLNSIRVTTRSKSLMKDFVQCLVSKNTRPLKMHIPDICFFENGQIAGFYCTNLEDGTIRKPNGILSEKQLQGIFRKQRKKYREQLKLLSQRNVQNNKNYKEVHENFSDAILPAFFYEGLTSGVERRTILKEKRLIIHRDSKAHLKDHSNQSNFYQDEQAYVIEYSDGNHELLTVNQFSSLITNKKCLSDIYSLKSYIKPQSDSQKTFLFQYSSFNPPNFQLLHQSQSLIEALALPLTVSPSFQPFDSTFEQLLPFPTKFMQMQCYRLVCYIDRVHGRKTHFLKTRWVLDEVGNYYLYDVLDWDWQRVGDAQEGRLGVQVQVQTLPDVREDKIEGKYFVEGVQDTRKHQGIQSISTVASTMTNRISIKTQVKHSQRLRTLSKTIQASRYPEQRRSLETVVKQPGARKRYRLQPLRFSEAVRKPSASPQRRASEQTN